MKIEQRFLTLNQYSRPGLKLEGVKKVAVHYTGNPGSTAINNRNYFENLKAGLRDKNGKLIYVSSHYIVGLQGEVIQCIPENEWSYCTNSANPYSISIETCHPDSTGKFNEVTEQALAELVADIVKRHGLDPGRDVIRHYDVTGKQCPRWYVTHPEAWEAFKRRVKALRGGGGNQPALTPIGGAAVATAAQMEAFLQAHNPGVDRMRYASLVPAFLDIGKRYGVRGDIAFCQAMKETGWLKYGWQVKPEQNNFCGLGATNGGAAGASFPSVEAGVEAQLQHLCRYAGIPLPELAEVIDPRYSLVTSGVAPNWELLNGRWAVPGVGYGESIVSLWKELCAVKADEPAPTGGWKVETGPFQDAAKLERAKNIYLLAGFDVAVMDTAAGDASKTQVTGLDEDRAKLVAGAVQALTGWQTNAYRVV